MSKKLVNLSRELSYLLRHNPLSKNLHMDNHGWVRISELLSNDSNFTIDILKEIVTTDEKQRYDISDDGLYIRANQGHSIPVDLELKPIVPPDILYHGTVDRYLDSILKNGIVKGNRQYVHLSENYETAFSVASRRKGMSVTLEVQSGKMYKDGIMFYRSKNGVWLTDYVSKEYIDTLYVDSEKHFVGKA